MLDIHTHLYFPQYDDDRKETIKRAFDSGITMMISVSTDPNDHHKALAITELDERIFASVGLHPHYFNDQLTNIKHHTTHNTEQLKKDIAELRTLAENNPKIIAIGECGLDYFSHTDAPTTDEQKMWQKEGFRAQIRLAQELRLPMIIHCRPAEAGRDAYEDLFEMLQFCHPELVSGSEFQTKSRIAKEGMLKRVQHDTVFILHCYMGDTEVTKKFLTLPDVYFSFTGNITYPVKKTLKGTKNDIYETVKLIPLERMFMETDCPFLAPVPHRGKRNEPQFVVEVAAKIAEIQTHSLETVTKKMRENLDKVFFRT
jgi:TatD DNase family protein